MPNKDELVATLRECAGVVGTEENTLRTWENNIRMSAGRAAACRISIRAITSGAGCPKSVTADNIATAESLAPDQVKQAPPAASLQELQQCKNDAAARSALDGPSLPDGIFEATLAAAEVNARRVAGLSTRMLNECT